MKAAKDVIFGFVRESADRLGLLGPLEAADRVVAVRLLARRHHDRPRRLEVCLVCLPCEGPPLSAFAAFGDDEVYDAGQSEFDDLVKSRLGVAARAIIARLAGVIDPAEFADRVTGGR
jgi:hypothetical protein